MKVLIINDFSYVDGGASKVAIDTAILLSKKNIQVKYLSFCNHNKTVEGINHVNFSNQSKNIALKAINLIYNFSSLKPMHEFLKKEVDAETIVHLHVWIKNMSSKIFEILHDLDVKFIVTAHDYFLACPNGGLYNYNDERHCNLKPLSIECWKSNCDKRNYFQHLYRCFRHSVQHQILIKRPINCIFVSKYSEKILKPYLNLSNYQTIGNPIDLSLNKFKSSSKKSDKCIYVGRLEKEKGIHHLVEAFKQLNKKLIVVGSGTQEKKIKEISTNLEFFGWQDRETVIKLLAEAGLLIFPSLWHETFGLTIFEAASVGTPSLVSDKCATSEFISHNENGLIYEGGNVSSLKRNIENFFSKHDLRKKLNENCYSLPQKFENDKYTENLLTFYKKVADYE